MLPEATAEAFRGGWFHTGDLGRISSTGHAVRWWDRRRPVRWARRRPWQAERGGTAQPEGALLVGLGAVGLAIGWIGSNITAALIANRSQ